MAGSPEAGQTLWGASAAVVREQLERGDLQEITAYLQGQASAEASRDAGQVSLDVMGEALLLGRDSLYAIALVFARQQEWVLYRRAMLGQLQYGSQQGRQIAWEHIKRQTSFGPAARLRALQLYLDAAASQKKKRTKGRKAELRTEAPLLFEAADLALKLEEFSLAGQYWREWIQGVKGIEGIEGRLQGKQEAPSSSLRFDQAHLGLRLALRRAIEDDPGRYLRTLVLEYPSGRAHWQLQQELAGHDDWKERLARSPDGSQLLQSLSWKVGLWQKRYTQTLPQLFAAGRREGGKEYLSTDLRFWWQQAMLIGDAGRGMFQANSYRSQSRNVHSGRQRLEAVVQGRVALQLSEPAYRSAAYWYVRNHRSYENMQQYRSKLRSDATWRQQLLIEYLYFFLAPGAKGERWQKLPGFLASWQQEQPADLSLNRSSRRLFAQIYYTAFARKAAPLLQKMFRAALLWGDEELILASAWYYRLAKLRALSQSEWQSIPLPMRQRTIADIRLFVLRADQGQDLLPPLRQQRQQPVSVQQDLVAQGELPSLLSLLLDYGFADEVLRLLRRYRGQLPASAVVQLARRTQQQGRYDASMRMMAQLTYDASYQMSRQELELLYPRAFYDLMDNYATEYRLPLPIFYGLVRQESYFAPAVISRAGAVGLSQLMPATMREVARKIGHRDPDATDPQTNLKIGSYYLRYLIDHRWTQNFAQALMAYNAGLGNMRKWQTRLRSWPGLQFNSAIPIVETRYYVQRVSAGAIYYAALYDWDEPISVLHTVYPDSFPPASQLAGKDGNKESSS